MVKLIKDFSGQNCLRSYVLRWKSLLTPPPRFHTHRIHLYHFHLVLFLSLYLSPFTRLLLLPGKPFCPWFRVLCLFGPTSSCVCVLFAASHGTPWLFLFCCLVKVLFKLSGTVALQGDPTTPVSRRVVLTQCGQLHLPSGAFSSSGSRQTRWYALGQVSHRMISPPCWQTSQ